MKKDDSLLGKTKEYWKGVEEGAKHSLPSPVTLDIVKDLKNEIKGELQNIQNILLEQNRQSNEHRRLTFEHMQRVEPVIKKYEEEKAFYDGATSVANRLTYWSKVITAIGIIVLFLKYAILQIINK